MSVNRKLNLSRNATQGLTMPNLLAPDIFAQIMSLPDTYRTDVLELLGSSTVDEPKLKEIIEEILSGIEERQRRGQH